MKKRKENPPALIDIQSEFWQPHPSVHIVPPAERIQAIKMKYEFVYIIFHLFSCGSSFFLLSQQDIDLSLDVIKENAMRE